jgi:outer membrane usher protein
VDSVFVGLSYYWGNSISGSVNYEAEDGRSTENISLHKNPPLGVGYGYQLDAKRTEINKKQETSGGAAIDYQGPVGIYRMGYRREINRNSYRLATSGALAFLNRSLYFSRPINDGFTLVKVSKIPDVGVNLNNQPVGTTNSKGELLVPGLISYYANRLSISATDIPVNYDIKEIEKSIDTPLRGGSLLNFVANKVQAFEGKIFVVELGVRKTAKYWGLSFNVAGEPIETIVGNGGEVYFENIAAGRYGAKVFMGEKECNFELTIPDSEEMLVDIGEMTCEMD